MAPFFAAHCFSAPLPVAPVVTPFVTAVPTVAGWWWRVVASGLHIHTLCIGVLRAVATVISVVRWSLSHPFANGGTCCCAYARTQHSTIATTGGLAKHCAGCAADCATQDGTVTARALGADCSASGTANGTTDNRALPPADLLAQNGSRCSADTATQNGFQSIGVGWRTQCAEHQSTRRDPCDNGLAVRR